mgnify:CR=1 FL=1
MIRRLVLDDLTTKLMAVVLAAVVWVFLNQGVTNDNETLTVTAEARLTVLAPRGMAILRVTAADGKEERLDGPTGGLIQVILRGTKTILSSARRGIECRHLLKITEDVSASEPTTVTSEIRPTDFDLPRGIDVVKIDPARIQILLAQESVRLLRIASEPAECLSGKPPEGFQVDTISFIPTHVHVRGLAHVLNRLNAIPIVPVDISDRKGMFSQRVSIRDEIQGTPVSTNEPIEMSVSLRPVDGEKTVSNLRIEMIFPDPFPRSKDQVRIAQPVPPEVAAIVRGPARTVELLSASRRIRVLADVAAADLATRDRGESVLRAIVEDPEVASLVKVRLDPPKATLEFVPEAPPP